MVAYFDTSAFVPLIVCEPGSKPATDIWSKSSAIVSTRLLFVETVSAISRSNRGQGELAELTPVQAESLEKFWSAVFPLTLDDALMRFAADCATGFGLRGYDAVHCAAAAMIAGDRVVAASSDQRLLDAWSSLGLATFDPLQ